MFDYLKKSHKILGMNSRNLEYVRAYNLLKAKRFADDKLLSKKVLKHNELPVPALIAKIKNREELDKFNWQSLPDSFALKPNRGFGGDGIIVVYGKKKGRDDAWIKADRSLITIDDLKNHILNILDGSFSLSNTPDIAFFEERLKLLKLFKPYTYKGIPDIRVIVFNKVPVMAMLRLPTYESGGKANVTLGALGVGIDMASGVTTTAIQGKHKIVEKVPGTRLILSGIKIPYWKDILSMAVRAQEISGLGYLGADIAIDKERGPVFFELNARPGLSIQIANLSGLKERLLRVAGLKIKTIGKGVRVGMDLFGGEVEEEVEDISGKKVIGTVEKITLTGKDARKIEVEAKVDTGAGYTSIDSNLARQLGFSQTVDEFERINPGYETLKNLSVSERKDLFKAIPDLADTVIVHSSHGTTYRPMVSVTIFMDNLVIPAKVTVVDRSRLKYQVIVGKQNLKKFLIDTSKS